MTLNIKCCLFVLFLALCTHAFAFDWKPRRVLDQREAESVLRAGATLRRGLTRALAALPLTEARRLQASLVARDVRLTRLLADVYQQLRPELVPSAPSHCSLFAALGQPFREFVESSVLAQVAQVRLHEHLLFERPSTCSIPAGGSGGDYLLQLIEFQLRQGSLRLTVPLFLGLFNNIILPCLEPDIAEMSRFVVNHIYKIRGEAQVVVSRVAPRLRDTLQAVVWRALAALHGSPLPLPAAARRQLARLVAHVAAGAAGCRALAPRPLDVLQTMAAIRDDEFPRDVVHARDTLSSAISSGKVRLPPYAAEFSPADYAQSRTAVLLAYLQRLSMLLPVVHPASPYVHTLLVHVKMKHMVAGDLVYVPSTHADMAMLLNSFGTTGIDLKELNENLYAIFRDKIPWQQMLHDFPYHTFSQPRPLLMKMLETLLRKNFDFDLCHKIAINSFLDKIRNYDRRIAEEAAKETTVPLPLEDHHNVTTTRPTNDTALLPAPLSEIFNYSDLASDGTLQSKRVECCLAVDEITVLNATTLLHALQPDTPYYMFSVVFDILSKVNIKFTNTTKKTLGEVLSIVLQYLMDESWLSNAQKEILKLLISKIEWSRLGEKEALLTSVCPEAKPVIELTSERATLQPKSTTTAVYRTTTTIPGISAGLETKKTTSVTEAASSTMTPEATMTVISSTHPVREVSPVSATTVTIPATTPVAGTKPGLVTTTPPAVLTTLPGRNITSVVSVETESVCTDIKPGLKTFLLPIGSLFQPVATSGSQVELLDLLQYFSSAKTQQQLKGFDFEKYRGRNDMFFKILEYIGTQSSLDSKIRSLFESVLSRTKQIFGGISPDIYVACNPLMKDTPSVSPHEMNNTVSTTSTTTATQTVPYFKPDGKPQSFKNDGEGSKDCKNCAEDNAIVAINYIKLLNDVAKDADVETVNLILHLLSHPVRENEDGRNQCLENYQRSKTTKPCSFHNAKLDVDSFLELIDDITPPASVEVVRTFLREVKLDDILKKINLMNYKVPSEFFTDLLITLKKEITLNAQVIEAVDVLLNHTDKIKKGTAAALVILDCTAVTQKKHQVPTTYTRKETYPPSCKGVQMMEAAAEKPVWLTHDDDVFKEGTYINLTKFDITDVQTKGELVTKLFNHIKCYTDVYDEMLPAIEAIKKHALRSKAAEETIEIQIVCVEPQTKTATTVKATTNETKGTIPNGITISGTTPKTTLLLTGITFPHSSVTTTQGTEGRTTVTHITYQIPTSVGTKGTTTVEVVETGTTTKEIVPSTTTAVLFTELGTSLGTAQTTISTRGTHNATATTVRTEGTITKETKVTGTNSEATVLPTGTSLSHQSMTTTPATEGKTALTQPTYQIPTTSVGTERTTEVEILETGTTSKELVASWSTSVPLTELGTSLEIAPTTISTLLTHTVTATTVETEENIPKETTVTRATSEATILSTGTSISYQSVITTPRTEGTTTITQTTSEIPTTTVGNEGTTTVEITETGTTSKEFVASSIQSVLFEELETSTAPTTISTMGTNTATATTVITEGTIPKEKTVTGITSKATVLATGTSLPYQSVTTKPGTEGTTTITQTTYQIPTTSVGTEGTTTVEIVETGTTSKELVPSSSTTVLFTELETSAAPTGISTMGTHTATATTLKTEETIPKETTVTRTTSEATVPSTGTSLSYESVTTTPGTNGTTTVTQTTYQLPTTYVGTEGTTTVETVETGTTSNELVPSSSTSVLFTELETSTAPTGISTMGTHTATATTVKTEGNIPKETTVTGTTAEVTVLSTGTSVPYQSVTTKPGTEGTTTTTQTTYQIPTTYVGTEGTTTVEIVETGTTSKELVPSSSTTVLFTELETSAAPTTISTMGTHTVTATTVKTEETIPKETTASRTTSEATVPSTGTSLSYESVITTPGTKGTTTVTQTTYQLPTTSVGTEGTTTVEIVETGTTSKELVPSSSTSVLFTELETSTAPTANSTMGTHTATATTVKTEGTIPKETTVTGTTAEVTVLSTGTSLPYQSVTTIPGTEGTTKITQTTYHIPTTSVGTEGTTTVEIVETGTTSKELVPSSSTSVLFSELETSTAPTTISTMGTHTATATTVKTEGTIPKETTVTRTTSETTVPSTATSLSYESVTTTPGTKGTTTVSQTKYQFPTTSMGTEGTTTVEIVETGTTSKELVASSSTSVLFTELETSTAATTISTMGTHTATETTVKTEGTIPNETTVTATTSEATVLSTGTSLSYESVTKTPGTEGTTTVTQTTYQIPTTSVGTEGTTTLEIIETGTTSKELVPPSSTSVLFTEVETSTAPTTISTMGTHTAAETTVKTQGTIPKETTVTRTTSEATVPSTATSLSYETVTTTRKTEGTTTVTQTTYQIPTSVRSRGTTKVETVDTGTTSKELEPSTSTSVPLTVTSTSQGTVQTTNGTLGTYTAMPTTIKTDVTFPHVTHRGTTSASSMRPSTTLGRKVCDFSIPKPCVPRTAVGVIAVNVPSLLETVDFRGDQLFYKKSIQLLTGTNVTLILQHLDMALYKTKTELLYSIAHFLVASSVVDDEEVNILIKILNNIRTDYLGKKEPEFLVVCFEQGEIIRQENFRCENEYATMIDVFPIDSLLCPLKENTPLALVQNAYHLFLNVDVSLSLNGLQIQNFRTKAQLLEGILIFLIPRFTQDEYVRLVAQLIQYINYKGCGAEDIQFETKCYITSEHGCFKRNVMSTTTTTSQQRTETSTKQTASVGTTHRQIYETETTSQEFTPSASTSVLFTELGTALVSTPTTISTMGTHTAMATTVKTEATIPKETTEKGTTLEATVLSTATSLSYHSATTTPGTEGTTTGTQSTYQAPTTSVGTEGATTVEIVETGTTSKELVPSSSTSVRFTEQGTSFGTAPTTISTLGTNAAVVTTVKTGGTIPKETTVTGATSEVTVLSTGTSLSYQSETTKSGTEASTTVTDTTYQKSTTFVGTEGTTTVEITETGTTSKELEPSTSTPVLFTELETSTAPTTISTMGTRTATETTVKTEGTIPKETTVTGTTAEATVLSTGTSLSYQSVTTTPTTEGTTTVTQTAFQTPTTSVGTEADTTVEVVETGTASKELVPSTSSSVLFTELETSFGTAPTTISSMGTHTATATTAKTEGTIPKETTVTRTTSETTVLSTGTSLSYESVTTTTETKGTTTVSQATYQLPRTSVGTEGTTTVEIVETGTTSKELVASSSTSVLFTELETSTAATTISTMGTHTATETTVKTEGTIPKDTTVTGTTSEATVLSTGTSLSYQSVTTTPTTEGTTTVTQTAFQTPTTSVGTVGVTTVEVVETETASKELVPSTSSSVLFTELETSFGTAPTTISSMGTHTATATTAKTEGTIPKETTVTRTTSETTVPSTGTSLSYESVTTTTETKGTTTVSQATYQLPRTSVGTEGTTTVEIVETGTTSKELVASSSTSVLFTELETSTVATTISTMGTHTATETTVKTEGTIPKDTTVTGTTSEATVLSTGTSLSYQSVTTTPTTEGTTTVTQTAFQTPTTSVGTVGVTTVEVVETETASKELVPSTSSSVLFTELETSFGTAPTTISSMGTHTATATTAKTEGTIPKETTVTRTTSETTVPSTGTSLSYESVTTTTETKGTTTVSQATYQLPRTSVGTEGTTTVEIVGTGTTSKELVAASSTSVLFTELETSTAATTISTMGTHTATETTVKTEGAIPKETTVTGTTSEATVLSTGTSLSYQSVTTTPTTEGTTTVTQTAFQTPTTSVGTEGVTTVEVVETGTASKELMPSTSSSVLFTELETSFGTAPTTISSMGTHTATATTVKTEGTIPNETTVTGTTSEATVLSTGTSLSYESVTTTPGIEGPTTVTQTTYQISTASVGTKGTTTVEIVETGTTSKELVPSSSTSVLFTELETSTAPTTISTMGTRTATETTVKTEGTLPKETTVTGTTSEATVLSTGTSLSYQSVTTTPTTEGTTTVTQTAFQTPTTSVGTEGVTTVEFVETGTASKELMPSTSSSVLFTELETSFGTAPTTISSMGTHTATATTVKTEGTIPNETTVTGTSSEATVLSTGTSLSYESVTTTPGTEGPTTVTQTTYQIATASVGTKGTTTVETVETGTTSKELVPSSSTSVLFTELEASTAPTTISTMGTHTATETTVKTEGTLPKETTVTGTTSEATVLSTGTSLSYQSVTTTPTTEGTTTVTQTAYQTPTTSVGTEGVTTVEVVETRTTSKELVSSTNTSVPLTETITSQGTAPTSNRTIGTYTTMATTTKSEVTFPQVTHTGITSELGIGPSTIFGTKVCDFIIPKPCVPSTAVSVITVNVPSLLEIVEFQGDEAFYKEAIQLFTSKKVIFLIQKLDMALYNTKTDLLHSIAKFLVAQSLVDDEERRILTKIMSNIRTDYLGNQNPEFLVLCLNQGEIIKQENSHCNNEYADSIDVIPINSLLCTLNEKTPHALIQNAHQMFINVDVSLLLNGIQIESFRTKAQLLEGVLLYLKPRLSQSEYGRQVAQLIQYIKHTECGAEYIQFKTKCSITLENGCFKRTEQTTTPVTVRGTTSEATVLSTGTTISYPSVTTTLGTWRTTTVTQTTYQIPTTSVGTERTTKVEMVETGTTSKELVPSPSTSVLFTETATSFGTAPTTISTMGKDTATATTVKTEGTIPNETTVTGITSEGTVLSTGTSLSYESVTTTSGTEGPKTVTDTTYQTPTSVGTKGTTTVGVVETGTTSKELIPSSSTYVLFTEQETSNAPTTISTIGTHTATATTVKTEGTIPKETTVTGTTSEATVPSTGTSLSYQSVTTTPGTEGPTTVTETTYQIPTYVGTKRATTAEVAETGTTSKELMPSSSTYVLFTRQETSNAPTTISTMGTHTATATTVKTERTILNETTVTGSSSEATVLSTGTSLSYPYATTTPATEGTSSVTQTMYQIQTPVGTKGTTTVSVVENGTTPKEIVPSASTAVLFTELGTSLGAAPTTISTLATHTATATTVDTEGTIPKETTVTGTTSEATVLSTGTSLSYPSVTTTPATEGTTTVPQTTYQIATSVRTKGTTTVEVVETGTTSKEIVPSASTAVLFTELGTSLGTSPTTVSTLATHTATATTVEIEETIPKDTTVTGTTTEATVLSTGTSLSHPSVTTTPGKEGTTTVTQTTYEIPTTSLGTKETTVVQNVETATTFKELVPSSSTTVLLTELETSLGTVPTTFSTLGTQNATETTVKTEGTIAKETTVSRITSDATVLSTGTSATYVSVTTTPRTEVKPTVSPTTIEMPTTSGETRTIKVEIVGTETTSKEEVIPVSTAVPFTEPETSLGSSPTTVSTLGTQTVTATTVKSEGTRATIPKGITHAGSTYVATALVTNTLENTAEFTHVENITELPALTQNVDVMNTTTFGQLLIPQPCLLQGKLELLTVDVDLLLHALDSSSNQHLLLKLRDMLTRINVQLEIALTTDFTLFNTQGDLLHHILWELSSSDIISADERPELLKALQYVRHEGNGARSPTHRIICIDRSKVTLTKMHSEPIGLIKVLNQRCAHSNDENLVPILRLPSIMSAFREDVPEILRETAQKYFNRYDFHKVVTSFNFFAYNTRRELVKNLLLHLSEYVSVPLSLRQTFRELVKYVKTGGESEQRQEVYVDCAHPFKWSNTGVDVNDWVEMQPKRERTTTESEHSVPAEAFTSQMPSGIQRLTPNASVSVEVCAFSSSGVAANVTDFPALIDLIPSEAPAKAKLHLYAFLTQGDLHKKLENFDAKKYSSGTELLQKLLVHIWLSYTYEYETKEAAKLLLPFVQEGGIGAAPPPTKIACINPDTMDIIPETCVDTQIAGRYLIEVISKNRCFYMNMNVTAVETYRLHSDTIVKTLSESAPKAHVTALLNFLRTPQSKKYLAILNILKMNTNKDFVDELLSAFFRFKHELPEAVKEAVTQLSAEVRPTGHGGKKLYVETGCKVIDTPYDVLVHLLPGDASHDVKNELNIIGDVMEYSNMSLKDFLPWISDSKPRRKIEILECVLLHLEHYNRDLTPHTSALLLYIRDKEANRPKEKQKQPEGLPPLDTQYKSHKTALNKTRASFKIDYPDLLKIIRANASKEFLNVIMDLFTSNDFEKYIENFNPVNFTTQGALLHNIFKHLLKNPHVSTKVKRAITELEPYIDYEDLGSMPPTIHKVYVKTKTEVNIVTLDFSNLFKALPRKSLSPAGKAALDAIFKYLSSPSSNVREILKGISTQQKSHMQLKIILLKLKQLASGTTGLARDIDIVLDHLHQEMKSEMSASAQALPNLDWLGILSCVPDEGMPPEVLAAKKDLYWFFISRPFRQDTASYLVDMSQSRAAFLAEILKYVRMRFEDKTLSHAVAYVAPFVSKNGPGSVPISYDEILPEEEDEAVRGEARLKELLYQMPGVVPSGRRASAPHLLRHLRQIFPATRRLQRGGPTYIGLDVLDELPPREQLLVLLRRVRHNYRLFLDDSTVAAINTVLQQMREAANDNAPASPTLDLQALSSQALGDAPRDVKEAMEQLVQLSASSNLPSMRGGQDLAPSLRVLEPKRRLAVALRLLWRTYTHVSRPADFEKHRRLIKTVYGYLHPATVKGSGLNAEGEHKRLVELLRATVADAAPPAVQEAVRFLSTELDATSHAPMDSVLQQIVWAEKMPQREMVVHALRRYRNHQSAMNPKLWSATTTVLRYLKAAEDDSSEDDEDISIVNEFKDLADVAGEEVASDRDLVLRFLVEHRSEVNGLFRGYGMLRQYPARERIYLLLQRVQRIFSSRLDPLIANAIDNILRRMHITSTDTQEVEPETIDAAQLLESVTASASGEAREAASLLVQRLKSDRGLQAAALGSAVVQSGFNPQRRAAMLLRRLQRRLRPQLSQQEQSAVRVLLQFLKTSPDSSLEDQFVGTVHFGSLFSRALETGANEADDVKKARERIVQLLDSGEVDVRRVLHGIHLWKLDPKTQVSLILYRLLREGRLAGADSQHVQRLLAALESDPEQAAAEDRDESVSPERLFSEALRSAAVPDAVVEARAVLSHVLRQRADLLYRGVHFERYATPVARLTAVLRNVWLHRDKFPRRVHQALKVMTDFLHIKIAEGEIDPYTFDFAAVFDVAVSSHAPEIVQQAKSVLLNAIKRRPALFKKLLALRVRDSDSEHQTARAVVTALLARRRQLSMKIRTALSLLAKFLQGQHIDQNDTFIRNMLTDDDYNEAADYDRHYVTLPVAKFKAKNRRF